MAAYGTSAGPHTSAASTCVCCKPRVDLRADAPRDLLGVDSAHVCKRFVHLASQLLRTHQGGTLVVIHRSGDGVLQSATRQHVRQHWHAVLAIFLMKHASYGRLATLGLLVIPRSSVQLTVAAVGLAAIDESNMFVSGTSSLNRAKASNSLDAVAVDGGWYCCATARARTWLRVALVVLRRAHCALAGREEAMLDIILPSELLR
jgi:hypothetical protein